MEAKDKLKTNAIFYKEFDVSEKAFKQLLRQGRKLQRLCLESSKSLNLEVVNLLFKPFMERLNTKDLKKKEEMIHEIKNYKPKSAYLELQKI